MGQKPQKSTLRRKRSWTMEDIHKNINVADIIKEKDVLKSSKKKAESFKFKSKKINNLDAKSKLSKDIICPFCNQTIPMILTYKDLNEHLKKCKEKSSLNVSEGSGGDFQLAIDYGPNNEHFGDYFYEEDSDSEEDKENQNSKNIEYNINMKAIQNYITNNKTDKSLLVKSIYSINEENLFGNFTFMDTKGNIVPEATLFKFYIDQMVDKGYITILKNKTIAITKDIPKEQATLLGSILTKTLIDNININIKISLLLLKQIFGFNLWLDDIKEVEPKLFNLLSEYQKRKDFEGLCFIIEIIDEKGNKREDELLFNGKDIKVNKENLNDYIQKRINYEFKAYNSAIIEITQALFEHIPKKLFIKFSPEELQKMFNELGKK